MPKDKDHQESFSYPPVCHYHSEKGYIVSQCVELKPKKEKEKRKFLLAGALQSVKSLVGTGLALKQDFGSDVYELFVSDGFVSLQCGDAVMQPVKILRQPNLSFLRVFCLCLSLQQLKVWR